MKILSNHSAVESWMSFMSKNELDLLSLCVCVY